jgi:hypothetical protein
MQDAGERGISILTFLNCPPNPTFAETFERCCDEFEELFFASAYCSWPRGSLLNSALRSLDSITAVLAPVQNNEENGRVGFRELVTAMKEDGKKVHVHEFQQSQLFHPKLYVFRRSDKGGALIIGSSNFTRAAFSRNEELDILVECKLEGSQFDLLRQRFNDWLSGSRCLTRQCDSRSSQGDHAG